MPKELVNGKGNLEKDLGAYYKLNVAIYKVVRESTQEVVNPDLMIVPWGRGFKSSPHTKMLQPPDYKLGAFLTIPAKVVSS